MTADLPQISLVTCSYQQGKYLDATIRSVLDQAYARLEYLIIDGGSTDGSVDTIRQHSRQLAYWVSEPDQGQTDALIKGFLRSSGEVQGWLCSDDLLLPGGLDTVGRFFRDNPHVSAMYGDALWIDAEGLLIRPKREMAFNRFVFLHDHNYVPQPSMFWRRSLYERVGGLDRSFHLAMDTDLWERFSRVTRIWHLSRYLSCMRFYPEQKTRRLHGRSREEDTLIRLRSRSQSFFGKIPYPAARLVARALRIASKTVAGGYGTAVPQESMSQLGKYIVNR